MPLLAGLDELLPWLLQWHNEPTPDFGGTPGDYFVTFLDSQLHQHGLTRQDLKEWLPPTTARRRRKKTTA